VFSSSLEIGIVMIPAQRELSLVTVPSLRTYSDKTKVDVEGMLENMNSS